MCVHVLVLLFTQLSMYFVLKQSQEVQSSFFLSVALMGWSRVSIHSRMIHLLKSCSSRFIVIGNHNIAASGSDKTSILISIDNKINFTHYDDNNQWNLGNYHWDEKEKNNIVYKFNIKRIPKYYEINIIFPIFVIASLCVWNTFIPITLG